jgi:hypothetical protein
MESLFHSPVSSDDAIFRELEERVQSLVARHLYATPARRNATKSGEKLEIRGVFCSFVCDP